MPVKALTLVFLCATTLGGFTAPSAAQETAGMQSIASVRQAAERAVRRELESTVPGLDVKAVALDARLRLPAAARRCRYRPRRCAARSRGFRCA